MVDGVQGPADGVAGPGGRTLGGLGRTWRQRAVEVALGARVVRMGPDSYQVQRLDEQGGVRACVPGTELEFRMFGLLCTADSSWVAWDGVGYATGEGFGDGSDAGNGESGE